MPNCREVAYLINSDGLEDAPWPMRLMTQFHLFRCKNCRQYAAELEMMGAASRDTLSSGSVDPKTVQRLEGTIMDYLLGEHEEDQKDVSGGGGKATSQ